MMQLLTLIFTIGILFSTGNCSCEDTNDTQHSDICHEILYSLENALIQDKGNLYRSRKAFFNSPNADPVLLRVEYNLMFSENITEDVLPYCINANGNDSALILTEIIHGWTSRWLYKRIDPSLLDSMQLTLPFRIIRYFQKIIGNDKLIINLNITSLPCIPSVQTFNSTVEDLTTFLKVYASHGYQCISDTFQAKDIGVTLTKEAISSNPPVDQIWIMSMSIFYYDGLGSGMIVLLYMLKLSKNTATALSSKDNIILLQSTAVIGTIWMFIELIGALLLITEDSSNFIFMSIIFFWTVVWYIFLRILYAGNKRCHKSKKFSIRNMFVTLHIATCLLPVFHFALPTILLSLVHPMEVIVIITSLITSVFITIILCSIYVLGFKQYQAQLKLRNTKPCKRITRLTCYAVISIFIVLSFSICLIFLFPLMLLLSQSSSISAGPVYTIVPLLPSAALAFVSWILKNNFFHFDPEFIAELQRAKNTNDPTEKDANDSNADMDEEHVPLLRVEENIRASEPKSESSLNLRNRHDYGATEAEDKSSETNC